MKSFILIHGAYHGSWCWNKIVTPLADLGCSDSGSTGRS